MNEAIFLFHIACILAFIMAAVRLGKGALVALSCLLSITANLFVVKQTVLFGLNVTCADAYAVGAIFILNLVQEYYGKESANQLIWINFFCMIFFALTSQLHLLYIPSSEDWSQQLFMPLLSVSPRILLASLFSYLITQKIDLEIFSKIRNYLKQKHLFLSLFISVLLSQFVDTCLFSFLGLYGIVSSLYAIIILSMIIKVIVIMLMSCFASLFYKKVTT